MGPEALSYGWSIVAEQSNIIRNHLIAIFGYIGEYYIYKQMEMSQTYPMDIISFMISSSLKWRSFVYELGKCEVWIRGDNYWLVSNITVGELRSTLCTIRSVPRRFLDVR